MNIHTYTHVPKGVNTLCVLNPYSIRILSWIPMKMLIDSSLKWKYHNLKYALAKNIRLISSHVIGFLQDSSATPFSF